MNPRKEVILQLRRVLGPKEAARVYFLSQSQAALEDKWRGLLRKFMRTMTEDLIDSYVERGKPDESVVRFDVFFFEQAFDVCRQAIIDAEQMPPIRKKATRRIEKLTVYPKGKTPKTLKALREWHDFFKKSGRVPPRQRDLAERAKKAYLNKVQSVWEKYSRDFRNGTDADKDHIIRKMKRAADTHFPRARTIVETESTRYYNATRRAIYDESDDITHYLFVAIRDHATTKWCRTRSGLVYAKGDPLLEQETPPCHWNCRSEILPLSPLNPRHAALIADKTKARRNNQCEPLPKGWNRK